MEYTFKFNEDGQFSGYQKVHYELNGQQIAEGQYFDNGRFQFGFIMVHGVGSTSYTFRSNDWQGDMELARDAAEGFAVDTRFDFRMDKDERGGIIVMLPLTEESLVL